MLDFIYIDMEWCGSHSFLFLAKKLLEAERRAHYLEQKCSAAETFLESEKGKALLYL